MRDVRLRTHVDSPFEPRSSRTRGEGRPNVSVVCVASDEAVTVFRDLADRSLRWSRLGVEMIIVCAVRHSAASTALAVSAGARLIHGPPHTSRGQLRSMGLAAAAGDVVMLVDDPTTADEEWIERLCTGGRGTHGSSGV